MVEAIGKEGNAFAVFPVRKINFGLSHSEIELTPIAVDDFSLRCQGQEGREQQQDQQKMYVWLEDKPVRVGCRGLKLTSGYGTSGGPPLCVLDY